MTTPKSKVNADPEAVHHFAVTALRVEHDIFYDVFLKYSKIYNQHDLAKHVRQSVENMDQTPWDDQDASIFAFKKQAIQDNNEGFVDRRGPKNPFRSKKFNKKKYETKTKKVKTEDPGLQNIPLVGRQIVNIATGSLLFWVFLQELVYAAISTGIVYDPSNGNIGPSGEVLNTLGALNTNAIRDGQLYRLFWACYMHSGWVHITMNLICQIQYILMYEPDWGFWRVVCVFFGSALSGNLLSSNLDPCMITVGSSGSLFGLMGACIPYCIEYWTSLPRPWMIAAMTVIVMTVTVLMGFNESGTDNFAHIGGGIAGIMIGFMGTVNLQKAPECCKKKKPINAAPKEVRKNWVFRKLQQMKAFQGCKCGWREWALRLFGFFGIAACYATGFYFLLVNPKFQPIGSLTWDGITPCCCCIPPKYRPSVVIEGELGPDGTVMNDDLVVNCGSCAYWEDGTRKVRGSDYPAFDTEDYSTMQKYFPCAWVGAPTEYETSWDEWNPDTWIMPEEGTVTHEAKNITRSSVKTRNHNDNKMASLLSDAEKSVGALMFWD